MSFPDLDDSSADSVSGGSRQFLFKCSRRVQHHTRKPHLV